MSTKKTQEESEQPAKVYQLDALGDRFATLENTMQEGFNRLNSSVNTLVIKSESQVTPQQLTDNITAVKSSLEKDIEEEVNKIHLEYGPLKDQNKWFIRLIGGQALIMIGQLVFIVYVTRGS
jgi:di/tripeptidase